MVRCGSVSGFTGPSLMRWSARAIASACFPSSSSCRTCGKMSATFGASTGFFHGMSRLS